jgi:hypothetical protein
MAYEWRPVVQTINKLYAVCDETGEAVEVVTDLPQHLPNGWGAFPDPKGEGPDTILSPAGYAIVYERAKKPKPADP